jgi:hypothetical protein
VDKKVSKKRVGKYHFTLKTYPYVFTLSAIYCYVFEDARAVGLCNLLKISIPASRIQNSKVQETHVETVYSGTDCTFPILFQYSTVIKKSRVKNRRCLFHKSTVEMTEQRKKVHKC